MYDKKTARKTGCSVTITFRRSFSPIHEYNYNQKMQTQLLKLFLVCIHFVFVSCLTCDTPDEWLSGDTHIQHNDSVTNETFAFQNIRTFGPKWPGGVVKYKISTTLTSSDIDEIQKAFEEYHTKTCIRFQPWEKGDIDFVSIELNNDVCGIAHVCKIGGDQFAQFGQNCRNMATMIHELGHSICLGHEHQRIDRDDHLSFSSCIRKPRKTEPFRYSAKGFYDYASQMHYTCNWCEGGWPSIPNVENCGEQATRGLSVLDVDSINALYNCQGCNRHRWIGVDSLTQEDKGNMHTFGYEAIYPCRAVYDGAIIAGTYNDTKKTCAISDGTQVQEFKRDFELLTIPGGLDAKCSVYQLVGTSFKHYGWTSYIAYGNDAAVQNYVGNVWQGERWPNGIIKYKFHASLELSDMAEIKKGFEEFHTKTCIRLEPWRKGDVDFVSFELDYSVSCGTAVTCKTSGHQSVKFKGTCRKMDNMVHSIGLSLCLGHEHKRTDRDEYLEFKESCKTVPQKDLSHSPMGMYDYESQWHWPCKTCDGGWPKISNVTTCRQALPGMSIIDADNINALYNCQGCHRHRWRPSENLTHEDKANMYSFGFESQNGSPLYPCRARVFGSVIAGKYDDSKKICYIYYNYVHEISNRFEILSIPGGPNAQCSIYKLENPTASAMEAAVPAGSFITNYKWKSHIAYASFNASDDLIKKSVGYIWLKDGIVFEDSAY
ncbi:Zinc metalloproteinase nas-6, partial [Orchesella cincta]